MEYLQNYPMVAVAAVLGIGAVVAMLGCSVRSYRFLRALREQCPVVWEREFGRAGPGTLRLLGVTPGSIARQVSDAKVLALCDRHGGSFRQWRWAALLLIAATIGALMLQFVM